MVSFQVEVPFLEVASYQEGAFSCLVVASFLEEVLLLVILALDLNLEEEPLAFPFPFLERQLLFLDLLVLMELTILMELFKLLFPLVMPFLELLM